MRERIVCWIAGAVRLLQRVVCLLIQDIGDFLLWGHSLLRRRSPAVAAGENGNDKPDDTMELTAEQENTPSTYISSPPTPVGASVRIAEGITLLPHEGCIDISFATGPIISKASASLRYRSPQGVEEISLAGEPIEHAMVNDAEIVLRRRHIPFDIEWHLRLDCGLGLVCWLCVRNIGDRPVQIEHLAPLVVERRRGGGIHIGAALRRWSVYQHGWNSWSPTFARRMGESIHHIPLDDENFARTHLPHGNPDQAGTISSEWVMVLSSRGTRRASGAGAILFGFLTGADQLAELRLGADIDAFRYLHAVCYGDGIELAPSQVLSSEKLMIQGGEDPLALMESYADRLGSSMEARKPEKIPTGWCSWYYFFGENGEREVLENLHELERAGIPLEYILIDDGYQRAIGDWLQPAEGKFTDMSHVMQEIRAKGRHAGIWVAPFGLDADSQTYRDHPEWAIHDDTGAPVLAWQHFGQSIYALDVTHPEASSWLANVFHTMRHQWGVDLFKIDFLFAACVPGRRHDPHTTRAQALRRGLQIIRQAIGEDAFLLGCGAPLLPCIGFVDGMRVGPDVAGNWHPFLHDLSMPSAENALRNAVARYFMHRNLWINDPDCVLVRDRDDQSDLVLSEMRSLVSIVALLGGMTFCSDNLPTLRKGRFKYIEQILPPTGISARPLDLFENELPQCLALNVRQPWGEWLIVAAINWDDCIVTTDIDLEALGLPAGRYHVFNYWPRRYMGIAENIVRLDRQLPHETVILLFKAVSDEPDLLTTTFHVAQTLSEVKSVVRESTDRGSISLRIELERAGSQFGDLWFVYPERLKLESARVDGRARKLVSDGVGIAHLGITLNGSATVILHFIPINPPEVTEK